MFLNKIIDKNNKLIEFAIQEHKKFNIVPNSYVIDVDTMLDNAKKMLDKATELEIEMFYMAKQYGRVPYIGKKLEEMGYSGAVVVDHQGFEMCKTNNLKVAHIGHLSQVPDIYIKDVIEYGVKYNTFYSFEKMVKFNEEAIKQKKNVNAILKIIDFENDSIYESQISGFELSELEALIPKFKKLKNIKIVGVTSFPCFTRDDKKNKESPTNNLDTLKKARDIFNNIGMKVFLNTPSSTSINTLIDIKSNGGLQGEPGHSFTGTVRSSAYNNEYSEIPAMIYISEISHNFRDKCYAYGGGYYGRGGLQNALIVGNDHIVKKTTVNVITPYTIDYYFELNNNFDVGDTVVMCFRTQIFMTRARIVLVEGLNLNKPKIIETFNVNGKKAYE